MEYTCIVLERFDQIAVVTLNRPEVMNALNGTIMKEIEAVSRSFLDDEQTDLVISLNILSQLPILPSHYLEEHLRINQDDIQTMSRTIIERHLDYLARFSGAVCLITDIEREIFDSSGKTIRRFSALNEVPFPWKSETWIWEIAPLGEESLDYCVRHKVAGIPSLKDAVIR